jgi:hypothetical protein
MAEALSPPILPLLLFETPPGLEQVLTQEGVPFAHVRAPHPLALQGGRFVLFDGRRTPRAKLMSLLTPQHVAIDVDALRDGEPEDPFAVLIDTASAPHTWHFGEYRLTETVFRASRARLRTRLLGRLRAIVTRSGGIWARLGAYPFPYRSAFNLRIDLDEPFPDDYARFLRARRPLADCTTHFVSTHAYGPLADVLADLRRYDAQSHGHYHYVYREESANRRNLERAHRVLVEAGITPVGFAAPSGRWNAGLDRVLQDLGYLYSSDFALGYDDLPFFPWRDGGFSPVLQVPIHPVCEGLFLEAGLRHPWPIADYLVGVVRAKLPAGEPAFVYGHPERRLARFPEVLAALASAVAGEPFLWRVTLTEFARWWHWRCRRRWMVVPRAPGRYEIQFEDWDATYPLGLEIQRGEHVASLPITAPRSTLQMDGLAYERRRLRADLPRPHLARRPWSLRAAVRSALDWETITPVEELPDDTLRARLKKRLRLWKSGEVAR